MQKSERVCIIGRPDVCADYVRWVRRVICIRGVLPGAQVGLMSGAVLKLILKRASPVKETVHLPSVLHEVESPAVRARARRFVS